MAAYRRMEYTKIIEKLVITQVATEYDRKLIEDLNTLRAEFEDLIKKRKTSFTLTNVEFDITHFVASVYKFEEMKAKYDKEIHALEDTISNLKAQISNKRNEVLQLKTVDIETREAEIIANGKIEIIRRELAEEIKKYVALMDLKLYFDSELSIYQKLIASEELRLELESMSMGLQCCEFCNSQHCELYAAVLSAARKAAEPCWYCISTCVQYTAQRTALHAAISAAENGPEYDYLWTNFCNSQRCVLYVT